MEVQMDGIKIYKYSNKSPSLSAEHQASTIFYLNLLVDTASNYLLY